MGWALKNLSIIERARIAESLFVVKERGDINSGEWLNGICPLHEDANPSFGYNPLKDTFHCHARCQKDGDLVDLYCAVKGLDQKSGFIEFKKTYGSESGEKQQGGKSPDKGKAKGKVPAAMPESPEGKTAEATESPEQQLPLVDFQQMRETYAKFPPLPEAWKKRLWDTRRWSAEAIDRIGIRLQSFYRCRNTGTIRPVSPSHARIAIPIFDAAGELQNIRLYDPAAKINKIISWGKGSGENRLFPPPVPGDTSRAFLCEGEGDTIAAISLGLTAHTQTAKRKHWPEDQTAPFKDREVIIAYDADKPGLEYARAAADNLLGVASSIAIISWPDFMLLPDGSLPEKHGQDLTDFVAKHGKGLADLEALLPEAKVIDEESNDYISPLNFFGAGATGRYGFQPRVLAERLIADLDLIYCNETQQLYTWNGMFWQEYSDTHLKRQAVLYLGDEAQRSRYSDCADMVTKLCVMPNDRKLDDQKGWHCLKNGMFSVDTYEMVPFRKDFYATFQIAVTFDAEKPEDCPLWRKFLLENVQTPEAIEQLQEFFGYCLTKDTQFEMCLVMIGDGGDGKSLAQKILRTMCGPENCTSVGFDALEDQFQRILLFKKMVNMSSEVGGQVMESQYFKKIVSGDEITASYKHKDGFSFEPFVKMVFALNRMMKVKDNSDGFYRRLLPVKFKRQFLPGDPARDTHLFQKLVVEINGIFAWSLLGLARLRKRGDFNIDVQETQDILNEYKRMNSPVHAFVEDCCTVGDSKLFVAKSELYKAYVSYCGKYGFGAMHAENFYNELRSVVKSLQNTRPRLHNGERPRGFNGIGLLVEVSE